MTVILSELPDLRLTKLVSTYPLVYEADFIGKSMCPHCNSMVLRTKDSFWRCFRYGRMFENICSIRVRCHKYNCLRCGRYFNTRIPGIRPWNRSTEPLKHAVFQHCNKGVPVSCVAKDFNIGTATVERYYQQVISLESRKLYNGCPKSLGIDEHRFTRKKGFATTFCDLEKHRVFDVTLGRSSSELEGFLNSLTGRNNVRVICMDMSQVYRKIAKTWFPRAVIVCDRFHVIRLVNERFRQLISDMDPEHIPYNRRGLMRLMSMQRDRLTDRAARRLEDYFRGNPEVRNIYHFWQNLTDLLRNRSQNAFGCKKLLPQFLQSIQLLRMSVYEQLRSLGRTLSDWKDEIMRMFRFTFSNGITEGFHRKMKLIQRRAYGFRNFENYRMRVRVLCGS